LLKAERPPYLSEAVTYDTIEEAHAALTERLIDRTGIAGTAIGACDGNPCLKVYVVRRDDPVLAEVPSTFGGYPVDIEVSGEFRAGGTDPAGSGGV
jgi:hypothetical protein